MSRATVREALHTYLSNPLVNGFGAIARTQPKDLRDLSYTSGAPGVVSGAIGVIFFENQAETPQAPDGAGGMRLTTYTVAVQVFHQSYEADAESAMDHFDGCVDALCTRLRSDPSLGQPHNGPIISGAYESLSVEFGEPQLDAPDGGGISTWAVVRFPVLEWNQAT